VNILLWKNFIDKVRLFAAILWSSGHSMRVVCSPSQCLWRSFVVPWQCFVILHSV